MSTAATPPIPLPYTRAESDEARKAWGANCGPHALAAALGKSLDDARLCLPGFRGWTNPTMMGAALRACGAVFRLTKNLRTAQLCDGINRLQWEGPWLNPGVPARVAYQHTHWIAHFDGWVLCTAVNPYQWERREVWSAWLANEGERWHVTHHYALEGFEQI